MNMKVSLLSRYILTLLFITGLEHGYAQQPPEETWDDETVTVVASRPFSELIAMMQKYISDSTEYAIELGKQALTLSVQQNRPEQTAIARLFLAKAYRENDIYNQAYLMAVEANDYFISVKDTLNQAQTLLEIGWIYHDIDNGKLHLSNQMEALRMFNELNDDYNVCYTLNGIGLAYFICEEYEKALSAFEESLAIAKRIDKKDRQLSCYINIGLTLIELGMPDAAEKALQNAWSVMDSGDNINTVIILTNQFANLNIARRKFDAADEYLNKAETLIGKVHTIEKKERLRSLYEYRYKLYNAKGDFKNALDFMIKYQQIKDELSSMDYSRQLVEIRAIFESKKKDREILQLENEKKVKHLQRNMFIGGCIAILTIAFLIVIRLKGNQKRERKLAEMSKILVEKQLENAVLEKETLNAKLNFKNTEFTNLALRVSQRNEQLQNFLSELKELEAKTTQPSAVLKEILQRFKNVQNINKDGEELFISLESEYKDFLFNLLQQFPDLTVHEQRLCAQFRLNLSNKDIANINNVSVKSVEMARYRLRKHFNISPEENLMEFLKKF